MKEEKEKGNYGIWQHKLVFLPPFSPDLRRLQKLVGPTFVSLSSLMLGWTKLKKCYISLVSIS